MMSLELYNCHCTLTALMWKRAMGFLQQNYNSAIIRSTSVADVMMVLQCVGSPTFCANDSLQIPFLPNAVFWACFYRKFFFSQNNYKEADVA